MIRFFRPDNTFEKWENISAAFLFLLLWAYIIVKSHTVFYIHDEIVTKWAYMIPWNFLPYSGYVDANNHFLNSFLGGFFIRLFQSDARWIVRLPSLLAFPVYFWSLFSLRPFFNRKMNFYMLMVLFCLTPFLLDYFFLARGYALSMAFMTFAFLQMLLFFRNKKIIHYVLMLISWLLAVYANLTLIPFALAAVVWASLMIIKIKPAWAAAGLLSLAPIAYAVSYSFHLKEIGKLYYGAQQGFIDVTLHSLSWHVWKISSFWFDIFLFILALFIVSTLVFILLRSFDIFQPRVVFPAFFLLGLGSILGQHYLLGVNFPEDRAALFLVVFFFGSLAFAFDYLKTNWPGIIIIPLCMLNCILQFNLNRTMAYPTEHFEKRLISKIPDKIQGIPTSTGGRFWRMDESLIREEGLPLKAFQESNSRADTLADYIIHLHELRPDITELYQPVFKDEYSRLILYKRKEFLERNKIAGYTKEIDGTPEYFTIYEDSLDFPLFVRCSGQLEDISFFKEALMVFSAENPEKQKVFFYEGIPLVKSCKPDENGRISFDFTIALNDYSREDILKIYLWNKKKLKLSGRIRIDLYRIEQK